MSRAIAAASLGAEAFATAGTRGCQPGKDHVTLYTPRAASRRNIHANITLPLTPPPREPEPPRLSPDEIRQIVLELMG